MGKNTLYTLTKRKVDIAVLISDKIDFEGKIYLLEIKIHWQIVNGLFQIFKISNNITWKYVEEKFIQQ